MTRRGWAALLAVATTLLLCYGSLVPFRWHEDMTLADAWQRWDDLRRSPESGAWRGDFVVNVLVFLPFGLSLAAAIAPHSTRAGLAALPAIGIATFGFGALLEFSQLFIRGRTASMSDVWALGFGGVVGALLWTTAGPAACDRVTRILAAADSRQRASFALAAYALLWVAVGLLPLGFPEYAYPLVRSVWLFRAPESTFSLWLTDWILSAVAVAPIGATLGSADFIRRNGWRVAAALSAAAVLLLALDALRQISPFDVGPEPASRMAGLIGGFWVGRRWRLQPISSAESRLLLVAWCVLIVAAAWAPFDFGISTTLAEERMRIVYQRAPFARHYWAPPLVALNIVMTVMLLGAGLGVLLDRVMRWRMALSVTLSTMLFAVLEWGQIYLPGRRADPSDVVIAAIGAFIGVQLARAVSASRSPLPGHS
jgi:VanZ family protein